MRIIYFIILFILVSGCEKPTTWELQSSDTKLLIVDGMITNEFRKQTIKLRYTMASGSEVPEPVIGASVVVEGKTQTFTFVENPVGSGNYESTKPFVGIVNIKYLLTIVINTKIYIAEAKMVPITPSNPLTYELINANDSLYRIASVAGFYEVNNPAMYEVFLDWSAVPKYANTPSDSCKAKMYFYSLPSIDVSQAFSPAAQEVKFPKGSIITERKYSLTPKHAEFIRSLLFETRWRGGYFDETSSNVKTNMSEGALGYFAACVVSETKLEVK